jgi:2'-5' RNA ligase
MRLFIAVNFPPPLLDALNARVALLRPRLPAAAWVKEGTQHVTLAFLGEQPETSVGRLTSALSSAMKEFDAFEAQLHGCGFFPNPRRARVGWIGLDPEEPFVRLAQIARETVVKNGVVLDAAEFRPHLTLMRMRDPWPPASIDLFGKSLGDYRSAPFPVDEITLFASDLQPKGAVHTPLRVIPLSGATALR